MSKRDSRPMQVFLRVDGSGDEQLVAVFYNETWGFSAFDSARQYAGRRTPGSAGLAGAKAAGWYWRFERAA
mgnify:FL=1